VALGRGAKRSHPEPVTRLVRFEATDGAALSGLLYEPPGRKVRPVVVYLHGTGGSSIFDSKRTNAVAAELLKHGIAFFPFNNRGAYMMRRVRIRRGRSTREVPGGMSHELIRDCVHDIDGAIRLLRSRGFTEIYLAGHSTGANKAAVYDARKPRNTVRGYILIAGGDDTGMLYDQFGRRRFTAAVVRARAIIKEGRGDDLVPESISDVPMSWKSFYDMANPDGDYNVFPFLEAVKGLKLSRRPLFRHVKGIRKPTLAIYGQDDEYFVLGISKCLAAMVEEIGPRENFELVTMAGADHGFTGKESELGALIADWIRY
jgi:pimeloyl-ACP methyl ester carboxylesterase